jgi:hypothetical protein
MANRQGFGQSRTAGQRAIGDDQGAVAFHNIFSGAISVAV